MNMKKDLKKVYIVIGHYIFQVMLGLFKVLRRSTQSIDNTNIKRIFSELLDE